MRAFVRTAARRRRGGRRREDLVRRGRWGLVASAVGAVIGVVVAAVVALRGRSAVTAGTTPPPSRGPVPEPVVPPAPAGAVTQPTEPAPGAEPDQHDDEQPDEHPDDACDEQPDEQPDDAVVELTRVSGLGRRSAEVLVAGGVGSLQDLASRTDDDLAALLDAAGLRHSTVMSSWQAQARRLSGG